MPSTILIIGASTRAAAHSAIRAGYRPIAADMFGDTDLAACNTTLRVDDYPHGLEAVAESLPQGPYMYTGALENHPALVDRIAHKRKLYGNPSHVLRRIRDPFQLVQVLKERALPYLQIARHPPQSNDGPWVRKPFKSCGGDRITLVQAPATGSHAPGDNCCGPQPHFYVQQFMDGVPCSALYVAAGGRAVFLGATRQLVGAAWTGATGFQYCGSLGPLVLPEGIMAEFQRIGDCLASQFGLIGIMGVDAVIAENRVWPVEVNPRYTASVEVLERATNLKSIAIHVKACRDGDLPSSPEGQHSRYCGKAIVYADKNATVAERLVRFVQRVNQRTRQPAVADIPPAEQQITARAPVVTVFAEADSLSSVRQRLKLRVRRVRRMLYH